MIKLIVIILGFIAGYLFFKSIKGSFKNYINQQKKKLIFYIRLAPIFILLAVAVSIFKIWGLVLFLIGFFSAKWFFLKPESQ